MFCLSVSPHRYNLPMTQDFLSWEAVGSRRKRSLETEFRSYKRSPKKEDRRSVMSREQSDDEDSVGGMGIIRFEPPNGAKPKWLRHGLPLPRSPEPGGQLPGAGVHSIGFRSDYRARLPGVRIDSYRGPEHNQ